MAAVDVLVVGAGAAGLMAAITASKRGRRTVLLEKNQRPGLKILISGGGRCNLTTTRSGPDLEAQFGPVRGRFLRHALRSFPPAALCTFFETAGVPLQEEDLEKVFPVSQQARDIVDTLLRLAQQAGVELCTGEPMRTVRWSPEGFVVQARSLSFTASRLVLATGGLSYPKTGTTGDGYEVCRGFGHTITKTWPALAPLVVEAPWVHALQGIVLHGVKLAAVAANRQLLARERPILFTHKGLSGPAPMDLAGDIEAHQGASVCFDFAPGVTRDELQAEWLAAAASHGARRIETVLPAHLPERLRATLVQLAAAEVTLAALSRQARARLLELTKDLRVPVPRSLGFDHAEVTRGGVQLDEIDAKTMESRRQPGLYVCGELLDVDGPIGGFNFQAAFATGRLAGLHA